MVGRAAELADVSAAVTAAHDGHGRLVLISGPPGIGKTTLADAAVDHAGRLGLQVARGCAVDDPGAPPLWPWRRVMRGWPEADSLPLPRAGASDAGARFALFMALSDLLTARARPDGLLIVLEDMHWADRTSVLLLRHLMPELAEQRLAVVVTYRDAAAGPLTEVLPDLLRGDAARPITLAGLPVADVVVWLPRLTGAVDATLAPALHERTGGNPLLIRLLAEDLAARGTSAGIDALMTDRPQLRRLVIAKVAGLSAETRGLIDAASVLGERVERRVLTVMAGGRVGDVDVLLAEALATGVLREAGDGVLFEHALVRDAVYGELSAARREHLHRCAARALESTAAPAGPIAAHWQRADGPDALARCQQWAVAADEQARTAFAYDDAARSAELAVACARKRADDELPRVLIRCAQAQLLANHTEASVDTCVEAADRAAADGHADLVAQAGLVIHGVRHPPALLLIARICERGVALVDADDHVTRARLLAQIAVTISETEEGPRGADLAAQALAEADRSGDPVAILEAVAARHLSISGPDTVAERLELGRRANKLGSCAQQPMAELWGHLWRTDAAFQLGNIAEAQREMGEIDRVAVQRGFPLARWHHHRLLAAHAAMTGDFGAARRANQAAWQLGERVGDMSLGGLSYTFLAQLAILRGDPEEMLDGWEDFLDHAPPMPIVRLVYPILHALAGDMDRARVEFEEFRHLPETFPLGVRWAGTMRLVAKAAVLLNDSEVAAACYNRLHDTARYYSGDGSGVVFLHGANALLLGQLAGVAGRPRQALGHYDDAVAMNARVGARPFTALGRLGWAQALVMLEMSRDPKTGQSPMDLLDQATAEFERLDMPGPLGNATGLRAQLAATPHPPPLTARESEVAGLVAQALSNKQIAEQLFLSDRTVETHVRSILAKLNFTTRTEIATWVLRSASG